MERQRHAMRKGRQSVTGRKSFIGRADRTGIPLLIARVLVGGWFIYLAINKLMDPIEFLKQVHEYGLVPDSMPIALNTIAIVLPFLEIACGLALITGSAIRGSAATIALMLVAFYPPLIIRALSIYHETGGAFCDVRFDCGCGTGEVFICSKLAENTVLLGLSVLALFSRSRRFCLGTSHPEKEGASGRHATPEPVA